MNHIAAHLGIVIIGGKIHRRRQDIQVNRGTSRCRHNGGYGEHPGNTSRAENCAELPEGVRHHRICGQLTRLGRSDGAGGIFNAPLYGERDIYWVSAGVKNLPV